MNTSNWSKLAILGDTSVKYVLEIRIIKAWRNKLAVLWSPDCLQKQSLLQ